MKKGINVLLFLTCLGGMFFFGTTEVRAAHPTTDVGIEFDKGSGSKGTIQPPAKADPIKPTKKPMGRLPSTGELVTTSIWMLLGTSLLIFFVGMVSLKTVMSNKLWERVC